jgi:hypothetical protein
MLLKINIELFQSLYRPTLVICTNHGNLGAGSGLAREVTQQAWHEGYAFL